MQGWATRGCGFLIQFFKFTALFNCQSTISPTTQNITRTPNENMRLYYQFQYNFDPRGSLDHPDLLLWNGKRQEFLRGLYGKKDFLSYLIAYFRWHFFLIEFGIVCNIKINLIFYVHCWIVRLTDILSNCLNIYREVIWSARKIQWYTSKNFDCKNAIIYSIWPILNMGFHVPKFTHKNYSTL